MSTYTWNSIEALFEKLDLHYLVVSLLLADIFYIVYFSFSYFVAIFELNDPYYVLQISAMSVLVGYEMAGIKYLLIETRKAFSKIKSDEDNYLISIKNAYSVLEKEAYQISLVLCCNYSFNYRPPVDNRFSRIGIGPSEHFLLVG